MAWQEMRKKIRAVTFQNVANKHAANMELEWDILFTIYLMQLFSTMRDEILHAAVLNSVKSEMQV
jgi:hypothetical protein